MVGCGAACVVQPMDLVKNRMQVSGEGGAARLYNNSIHCASTIIKNEGVLGLYNGLSVRDSHTMIEDFCVSDCIKNRISRHL